LFRTHKEKGIWQVQFPSPSSARTPSGGPFPTPEHGRRILSSQTQHCHVAVPCPELNPHLLSMHMNARPALYM